MLKSILLAGVLIPGQTIFIPVRSMEKYNGWTNRSTWAVHLWITNEWDYYSLARRDKFSGPDLKIWWSGICKSMPNIKDDCEPLSEVNWEEVSEALKED